LKKRAAAAGRGRHPGGRQRRPCVADPAAGRPRPPLSRGARAPVPPARARRRSVWLGAVGGPGTHDTRPHVWPVPGPVHWVDGDDAAAPVLQYCRTTAARHVVDQPAGGACRRLLDGATDLADGSRTRRVAAPAKAPCHGSQDTRHRCDNSAFSGGATRYVQGSWLAYQPAAPHSVAVEAAAALHVHTTLDRERLGVHDLWPEAAEITVQYVQYMAKLRGIFRTIRI